MLVSIEKDRQQLNEHILSLVRCLQVHSCLETFRMETFLTHVQFIIDAEPDNANPIGLKSKPANSPNFRVMSLALVLMPLHMLQPALPAAPASLLGRFCLKVTPQVLLDGFW